MFGKRGVTQIVPEGFESCAELGENWPPLLRLERRLLMPLYRIADTGVLGLTPLRTHILVCGFPRSGTTLLQLMLENAVPWARRFGRETSGWRAATYAWRSHAVVISKMPHDLFRLGVLRNFYSRRPAALKTILMLRDPRDVLTSQRKFGGPEGYCVSSQRWRNYYNAFVAERGREDCLVVRYEDLVADPDREQQRIEQFTGETMRTPFSEFHSVDRPDFETDTLNGLRPVQTNLVRRWAAPECGERIAQVLDELPALPQALIELGYEADTDWIDGSRGGRTHKPTVCEDVGYGLTTR